MRWRQSLSNRIAERCGSLLLTALVGGGAAAAVEAGARGQADSPPAQADSSPELVRLARKAATRLLLSQPKPEYPPLARLNYIQGRVEVEVRVTCEGRVSRAHVLRGHPLLAASAIATIRRWIYRPFVTRSGPAPFSTDVNVRFTLEHVDLEHIPPQAESDLDREVKPPQVLRHPAAAAGAASVRLRVLVSDEGQVMDSTPLAGPPALFAAARRNVEAWRFRPARYGNMTVPWYLEVDVPVAEETAAAANAASAHPQK